MPDGTFQAVINSSEESLNIFGSWLYTRTNLHHSIGPISSIVSTLLSACALGRETGCVNFEDYMMDEFIDRMDKYDGYFPLNEFIEESSRFESTSRSWKFMIDYLLHKHPLNCGDDLASVYRALNNAYHYDFMIDLARKICCVKDINVPQEIDDADLYQLVITGYFAAKHYEEEKRPTIDLYPWNKDRCQYHRHRELYLPCYKTNE